MPKSSYLIIGSGVAGISAAQEIRRWDRLGSLTMVSDELEPFYYRASLSEWISGQNDEEALMGRTAAFYDRLLIDRVTGHVVRVDPAAHRVELATGASLAYDKLLIATGARANVLPIEGLEAPLVFRTLQDARTIKERLGCCGSALIVGGGILGLELAGALHRMGIERIAVVQRSAPIGRPLLDMEAAEWLLERMRVDGIDVFINDTVARVEGNTALLTSGHTWEFEALVEAVGITPLFPEVPGLAVGRGIRIDAACRTNLPDIYAAGDCTETQPPGGERWRTTRIWLDCARQGKTAGRNMAGGEAQLFGEPFFNASLIYTQLYAYIGEPHGEAGESYVWRGDGGYRKVRVVEGRLAGALLLNARHGMMALWRAIGRPVAQYGADVTHPDFPWNALTGQDWDYLFY